MQIKRNMEILILQVAGQEKREPNFWDIVHFIQVKLVLYSLYSDMLSHAVKGQGKGCVDGRLSKRSASNISVATATTITRAWETAERHPGK